MDKQEIERIEIRLGKNIRTWRRARQISQAQLGKACGISFQQIQKYENGANRVSVSRLFQIAGILDLEIAELLRDVAPENEVKAFDPRIAAISAALEGLTNPHLIDIVVGHVGHIQAYERKVAEMRRQIGAQPRRAVPNG